MFARGGVRGLLEYRATFPRYFWASRRNGLRADWQRHMGKRFAQISLLTGGGI